MRGIPGATSFAAPSWRISPAHAGNTAVGSVHRGGIPDQPRTCGEYFQLRWTVWVVQGSAPHMRGIPSLSVPEHQLRRISPAHAGNTNTIASRTYMTSDQPRTCGEYMFTTSATREERDQPRTCGEYICPQLPSESSPGSAPHMRGILHSGRHPRPRHRISPAHAGNTAGSLSDIHVDWDQPRTCGEYDQLVDLRVSKPGSAPHMRGIQTWYSTDGVAAGISPAHAGNTSPNGKCSYGAADQPRTCGEYFPCYGVIMSTLGSAPHMRGILLENALKRQHFRISPAHAGNTGRCERL